MEFDPTSSSFLDLSISLQISLSNSIRLIANCHLTIGPFLGLPQMGLTPTRDREHTQIRSPTYMKDDVVNLLEKLISTEIKLLVWHR